MTTLNRAAFVSALAALAFAAGATPAFAARNTEAEQYVETQAVGALQALGNRSVSPEQRHRTFYSLMQNLGDMPRVATFVLGRYGTQLRSNAQLRTDWFNSFQEYSIAVYEDRLERYSDSVLHVTGSIERTPGRDVIVLSEMTPRGGNRPLPVQWRMLKTDGSWRVVDVSLVIEGSEI